MPRPTFPVVAMLLLGLCACGETAGAGLRVQLDGAVQDERAAPPADARAGLILLLLDTTRADRLDLYGHARATAPFLRELGEEGWVFERAYAAASWTRASTASLLTGRLPESHGVEDRDGVLVPELTTLAEVLADAGWDTKGVISNPHVREGFGFAQGFADYLWTDPGTQTYGDAPAMRGLVGQALARRTGAPLFLYLHYMDPHAPYQHHPEADFDPDYRGPFRSASEGALTRYMDEREALGAIHDERIRDLYDGEIAWLDRHLRELFERLRAQGLLETCWVVVTSDHGEGLWTHEEHSHGRDVYEEQIHVPLIVRPPNGLAGGRRIAAPISLIDVAPTLVDLLGLPPSPAFDGGSWAATLREDAPPPARPIVVDQELSAKPKGEPERIIKLVAVIDGDDKLVLDRVTNELTLFDLARDPDERAGTRIVPGPDAPPRARALFEIMGAALADARARRPDAPSARPDVSRETMEQIEALGYVGMDEEDGH